jgi:YidC/Oxa1 family membrane protein insertase
VGNIFEVLVVEPIFNLLVLVYSLLPGHNFGLALIIFTIIVRLLMWPLVKKQLHHQKAIRKLQPELKKIKKAAAGDKQKERLMVMELYKEREISPFGTIGILLVQLVILFGLYLGLQKVVKDPKAILDLSYPFIHDIGWLKTLAQDIHQFDATLLGVVDLTKAAIPEGGGIYWPAMFIVIGSAVTQYFQSVQLMPKDDDQRSLRQILREASSGKQSDQTEVNAAVARSTRFFIPALIFIFTVSLPSALGLYWLTSGLVAFIQQSRALRQDEDELEAVADKPSDAKKVTPGKKQIESTTGASGSKITILAGGEVLPSKTKKKTSKSSKKRRK